MQSDQIKRGVERAPNRSLLYALGMTEEDMDRPLIGVVSSYNEIVPGHMNLDKITEAVKAGVLEAGGYPIVFPAIAVCDGIAMGHIGMKYSLVTRDLICDSTEAMAIAHQFDGLVMVPNCDKNVPGLLMAAARLNLPCVFVSGGPMLAGRLSDSRRTCLSHMFEAVGARMSQLRSMLRHVHRQFHELSVRSHRNGASRQRDHSRTAVRPPAAGQEGRTPGDGNGKPEYPSP